MLASETLSNQVCCDSAVAAHALADARNFGFVAISRGHAVETPSQGVVSDPALFTAGWGNPDAGLFASVVDQQGPFGFEFGDFAVGNSDGVKRVHDQDVSLSKNHFGSNPDEGCQCTEDNCCNHVKNQNALVGGVEDYLSQEQDHERQSDVTKNKIALRAVNRQILHSSIFSGTPAVGKGK